MAKYEDRRRELHQAARNANPPPFVPDNNGRTKAMAYGDFWARCAPFVDEVVIAARTYTDLAVGGWASFALTEKLREAIDNLDEEATR